MDGQLPRRGRSASPLRGAVRGAVPEGTEVLLSGEGTAVPRRLRGNSPSTVEGGLKGAVLVEEGSASLFAADGSADLRGNRSAALVATFDSAPARRRVRRSVEAEAGASRIAQPLYSVGEDFAPEAAAASFPTIPKKKLGPDAVMGQMFGQPVQGEHHLSDTFGTARRGRGTGQTHTPILSGSISAPRSPRAALHRDANPITGLGEKAAGVATMSNGDSSTNGSSSRQQPQLSAESLKRRCKAALAEAMEISSPSISSPITFPGDRCEVFSPASDAVSPISLRPKLMRREGEFSPRRHSPGRRDMSPERTGSGTERRAGSPRSPRTNLTVGLIGSLARNGQFSPRGSRSSLVVGSQAKPSMDSLAGVDNFLQGQGRWKKTVPEAPKTGGASAALQWRG